MNNCEHKFTKRALARWKDTYKGQGSITTYCSVIDYCTKCGYILEYHRPTNMGIPLTYEEGLERFKENGWEIIDIPYMMALYINEEV